MKTETIDSIKILKLCASGLNTFFDRYKRMISTGRCDKDGATFNGDIRFPVFRKNIYFSSHAYDYGSSSTNTFSNNITSDEAGEALVFVLNKNKEKIFKEMADFLNGEAKSLTYRAEREIKEFQKLIDSLETL